MKLFALIPLFFAMQTLAADPSPLVADSPATPSKMDLCPSESLFSDITYQNLTDKLEKTLIEKRKSLVLLDFKGLQAQIDVLSNHLLDEDTLSGDQAETVLQKTLTHLDELSALLMQSKEVAKMLKDNHVVPLATLTSLKAEADSCRGNVSQYSHIFKILSGLNKELNEILMMSPYKIISQKEKVKLAISNLDIAKDKMVSVKSISEHFNFIQKHINSITQTFEFNAKVLHIASAQ